MNDHIKGREYSPDWPRSRNDTKEDNHASACHHRNHVRHVFFEVEFSAKCTRSIDRQVYEDGDLEPGSDKWDLKESLIG